MTAGNQRGVGGRQEGVAMQRANSKPVQDWGSDWDWLDERWGPDAIEIWNSLRDTCPVATTERYGRAVMPVSHDTISDVARDTENFSSAWISVNMPGALRLLAPPITADPPYHDGFRRLLLPAFNPRQVQRLEPMLRRYCRELIGPIADRQAADASIDYARHIPVRGICDLTGLPAADADLYRDWIHRMFQIAPRDNVQLEALGREALDYAEALLLDRLAQPNGDLLTELAEATLDGAEIEWQHKVGSVVILIVAGIDTTWKAISSALWHFGQHPDDVRSLLATDDDGLWDSATEEVLRFYAPVSMARKAIADTDIGGCPVSAGDQVLLAFPAANHDPAAFDDPDDFRIDRAENRHLAFGLGIHRCLGSNLARLELKVAIQEWLRAFPDYRLDPTRESAWANGQVRGPVSVPVTL